MATNCNDCLPCPPDQPCTCIGIMVPPSTPAKCPSPGNCLKLCDIVINPMNGVGPCGNAGTINVADTELFKHDFTACGEDTVVWKLAKIEGSAIASASITTAGVLTWITGGPDQAGKIGTVVLKACCGMLDAYMIVLIGVKDLCTCPECPDCDDCDPCTGDCIEANVDMAIGGVESVSNVSINGG